MRDNIDYWIDEPHTEQQWGVNSGDPTEVCDPWFLTDDEATAYETAQVIREPHILRRTVTVTYGPWQLVPPDPEECPF